MSQKGMDDHSFTLAAGVEQSREVNGDFFHVVTATSAFEIRFDDGKWMTRNQGQGGRVYYSRISVRSTGSQSVVMSLGFGYATDARSTVNATITAPIQPAALNVPLTDVSVGAGLQVLLEAAVATRLELLVGVASTEANGVRIGDNTAAAAKGLLVEPGQSVAFASSAAIYAFNSGAGAINVTLTSMRSP